MVYVDRDGTIHQHRPWGIGIIVDGFWGVLSFVYVFFRTLISPGGDGGSTTNSGSRGSRPGDPPGGPRRRMGGITTIQDCNMPGGG